MIGTPLPPHPPVQTVLPVSTGWRRYITKQRLRWFILLSVAAHLLLGMSWGVPAYLKQKRQEADQRAMDARLEGERLEAEKAAAQSKARNLAQTSQDVADQTRKAFDKIAEGLSQPEKEKTWSAIQPAVQPDEKQLAVALGDRSTTEQDLRNLQAGLDRHLIKAVDETMTVDVGREEVEAFLAGVESKVVPELIARYREESGTKIAQPVRKSADAFVRQLRDESAAAIDASDADRRELTEALKKMSAETDAAGVAADQVQARKPSGAQDDLLRRSEAAATRLASSAAEAQTAADRLSKIAGRVKPLHGGSAFAARLAAMADALEQVRAAIRATDAAVKAGDWATASATLTASALTQRKLDAQWTSTSDAVQETTALAEDLGLGAVGTVADAPLPQHIDQRFTELFPEKASHRLTAILLEALRKRLAAAHVTPDDALIASAQKRVEEILRTEVGAAGGYGLSTSQALRGTAARSRSAGGDEEAQLAKQFTESARTVIDSGISELLSDDSADSRLALLVEKPESNLGRDETRDRVAMLAAHASDGRDSSLDTVSLTDLRAGAMARSNGGNEAAPGGPDPGPTSAPADVPPVIDDIKKEILDSLQGEVRKVLAGKLTDEQTKQVWDGVAKAVDADVSRLARDLIDPNVSDSDLESRRLEFSGKVLAALGTGLDKTASGDLARELLKELEGKGGDAVTRAFRGAVTEHVGVPLAREWRGEATAERARASEQVRNVRDALESAGAVANRIAQILDKVKSDVDRSAGDGKGEAAAAALAAAGGKLDGMHAAIDGARTDLEKARNDVPAGADALRGRVAGIASAAGAAAGSMSEATRAAKSGDAAALAKALADAREKVEQLQTGLAGGKSGLERQASEIDSQFTRAAQQAGEDSAPGKPGVKSRIDQRFNGAFRKDALPKLADKIVKDYQEKLQKAGVSADGADAAALQKAVTDRLDAKVTGEAHAGEAVLSDLDRHKAFAGAKSAKSAPTTQQVERANEIADAVTDSGIAAAVEGGTGERAASAAVKSLDGPESGVIEAKGEVSRMQGQLRGGRGGVLADSGDAPADQGGAKGVLGMRRKWQSVLAGLNGDGTGEGAGQGKAAGGTPAGGAGAGSGGTAGAGAGAAGGSGLAGGGGRGLGLDGRYAFDGIPLDPEKRKELLAYLKDRGLQQGKALDRAGAGGDASLSQGGSLHPAAIVAPATRPAESARDDKPYEPTFKSLRFAVVPYLNKPIPVGDNFDAWKDIPTIHLLPERKMMKAQPDAKVLDDLPLKVAWDSHGLYFMLDMVEANGKLSKARIEDFWRCDCMEVFMDTMNTKELQRGTGAGQQFWFWPFGSQDDPSAPGGESFYDRLTNFHFVALTSEQLRCHARATPAGYQMQCCIPIERVRDADLAPGKILGFNIAVDTSDELHYYWSASKVVGTSYHPDTWGDILLGGSDGQIDFPDKLVSESGAEGKTVRAFAVGEPLRIRVTDRDMNLNDRVKDKVSVTVRNARGEQEIAILEETGVDTGVFEGSVRTALSLDEHVNGVVSVFEGETVAVTYNDQARANGARNTAIVSRIVAGPAVMSGK